MHEVDDRLHALAAGRHSAELVPGELAQLVRLAVPAARQVWQAIQRQLMHRRFRRIARQLFVHAGVEDVRGVRQLHGADGHEHAAARVAERVGEDLDGQMRSNREGSFGENIFSARCLKVHQGMQG